MFELLPKPLGSLFRKLTHFACNSPKTKTQCVTDIMSVQNHIKLENRESIFSVRRFGGRRGVDPAGTIR